MLLSSWSKKRTNNRAVMNISKLTAVITLLYLLFKVLSFIRYYIIARRSGFPLVLSPVFSTSILWLLLSPIVVPALRKWLPPLMFLRLDVLVPGFDFRHRLEEVRQLVGGNVFVVVCPDGCSLWCCDPVMGSAILQRRKDFTQGDQVKQFIGIFGPNVIQSDGEDWQRQRRIIAPMLNESIMATVWKESCTQAQAMIECLVQHPGGDTLEGLRRIAINVLGSATFGYNQAWSPGPISDSGMEEKNWGRGRVAYFKTIAMVVDQFILAVAVPSSIKRLWLMPRKVRVLDRQMKNVPWYVKEIFDDEVQKKQASTDIAAGKDAHSRTHNILDMLLQYSQAHDKPAATGLYLTDDEMTGNLWIFTAAGFDSTATTMGYAVMLLTIYPQYQDWMREELRELDVDISPEGYEKCFTRCPRVLAIMYETLRLFSPVSHTIRGVNGAQQLVSPQRTHVLSSPMAVFVCGQLMQSDPDHWGADVAEFNPKRWFDSQTGQLMKPPRDVFLPWSGGPRNCPGMKMAQVEFVATMSTLFRHAQCEVLPSTDDEQPEARRRRMLKVMDDSVVKLTLQVKDSQAVQLRWILID